MDKILKILLSCFLVISAILIGTPIQYNCIPVNIAIIAVGILWIGYLNWIKKETIQIGKLDMAVLVLGISTAIPILTKQAVSLNDSFIYFLKYISCFVLYLLSKYLVQKNSKNLEFFVNVIIICSVLLCIIGIDNMNTKMFTDWLETLRLPYVINLEGRMFSSLGYTNSFAAILAVTIILILDRMVNSKSKYGLVYAGTLFLNLACLILTYSRAVLVLCVLAILIYLLINRNKQKTITILYTLLFNGGLSLTYIMLWGKLRAREAQIVLWIATLTMACMAIGLQVLFQKIYPLIEKITLKTYVIVTILLVIVMIGVVGVGMQLVVPLTIFEQEGTNNTVKYKISNIKPNTQYSFQFDLEAKAKVENLKNYSITIDEENKYYDKVTSHEVEFNNYNGILEMNFTTSEETVELALFFENQYKIAQKGITINSLTINGEEYPLKYLYLPSNFVEKIKTIKLSHKSVWERMVFYQDAMKIIKNHWLLGMGGSSWKYEYEKVQTYCYATSEIHNYLLQIFMDCGIVGIISLLAIIRLAILKTKKEKDTEKLAIGIAFLLLIAHSCMDFNMSFFYIMVMAFSLLGILASEQKEEASQNKKIAVWSILVVLIIALGSGMGQIWYQNKMQELQYEIQEEFKNKQYNEVIEGIKKCRKTEKQQPYSNLLQEIDYALVKEENMEYIYDRLADMPITVNVEYNRKKSKIIEAILLSCQEQEKKKFAQLVIKENDEIVAMIKNKEKNRLTENEIKLYLAEQEDVYQLANSI